MLKIINETFNKCKHNVCFKRNLIDINFMFMENENKLSAFDRINMIKEEKGMTDSEFQKSVGIISQDWTNWRIRGVPPKKIFLVARTHGFSSDWIFDGNGNKYSNNINKPNYSYAPDLGVCRKIPVVGIAQLGDDGYWCEIDYPPGHGDGYINYPSKDAQAYALRCTGDSMNPRIRNGEFVIVEPNMEPIPGDEVMVRSTDGRVMVKILLYKRNGRVFLQSINDAHPSLSLAIDEIDSIHPIAGIIKSALWDNN